jgi:hypothetical protein
MLFNRILDITCYLSEHKFIENKNGCRPYTVGQPFSYLASLLSLAIERDILVVESLTGRTKLIKFLANIQQDSSGEKKKNRIYVCLLSHIRLESITIVGNCDSRSRLFPNLAVYYGPSRQE